jgi:cytochrome oxidase Cu insertion factor (SCO1/SenC/PrrC family)
VLAACALLLAIATLAHYARLVRAVQVPLAPRAHQALVAVAGLVALSALARGPGWIAGLVAVATLAVAALFLFLTTASRLPAAPATVAVGEPAPLFTADDADGRPFALAGLRGKPLLLKFFRGHW